MAVAIKVKSEGILQVHSPAGQQISLDDDIKGKIITQLLTPEVDLVVDAERLFLLMKRQENILSEEFLRVP